MNIVFVLSHELYLRNFANIVKGLADRGHAVSLTFTVPRHSDDPAVAELVASSSNITIVEAPTRRSWWWPVTDVFRGMRDYVHTLDPLFANAPKIRSRTARRVPGIVRRPIDLIGRYRPGRRAMGAVLDWIEWSIACEEAVAAWLNAQNPDALVISPLIDLNYAQLDILKAARHHALPSIYLVASWDNLTMKGEVQIAPDGMVVWNAYQVEEAIGLHGMEPARVKATGAQLYDQWFEMTAAQSREAFCAEVGGLDPAKPILLYAGSSAYICPDELAFFRRWFSRLRQDADPRLATANVLLRPHPLHARQWQKLAPVREGEARLAIWPKEGELPILAAAKQRYYDTLWHASALIGINTSAFLEAGILGRDTFTLQDDFFKDTQQGTLHFAYIAESGLLHIAEDIEGHMADLRRELARAGDGARLRAPFITSFLRPNGVDRPVVPQVIEAVEGFASEPSNAHPYVPLAPLWRLLLRPLAALVIRPLYLARARARVQKLQKQRSRPIDRI